MTTAKSDGRSSRAQEVDGMSQSGELTTREAADLLNVTESFLLTLLGEGVIPHAETGAEIRLCLQDVLAYKRERSKARKKHLADMLALAQETGTYN